VFDALDQLRRRHFDRICSQTSQGIVTGAKFSTALACGRFTSCRAQVQC
jgi:hypothetical protein